MSNRRTLGRERIWADWVRCGRAFRRCLLFGLLLLTTATVACGQEEPLPVVVTRITVVEGREVVVTRVIRQTVEVPVTRVAMEEEPTPVTLDLALTGDASLLDPQIASDEAAVDVIENVFAGLTRFDHENGAIEPVLARDWEVSDDGLIWTFHLRDDVFWVIAGTERSGLLAAANVTVESLRTVTADDFVYAIRRACDPRVATPDHFLLFIIEGCEELSLQTTVGDEHLTSVGATALDETTLQIRLRQPASYLLTLTSSSIMRPVPEEIVAEMGEDWSMAGNVATSGPFVISPQTLPGRRVVLLRNPLWPLPFKGNVEEVGIIPAGSAMETYMLWEDHEIDLAPVPLAEQANVLALHGPKADLIPTQAVFYLAYDFDSSVLGAPEVRRAFGWAIDRERLIREVHGGRALPMRHFGPPGTWGAPPIDEVGAGYNPDRARQQLVASGVPDCRVLPPIRYMVSASDLALQQAELLREMWMEELSCREEQIAIEQVQFGELLANTRVDATATRPDIWELGWAPYYPDENNWLADVLHCTISENRQRRPCSQADQIIRQAAAAESDEERTSLYRTVERLFFGEEGEEPITPLYVQADYVLRQSWVVYRPALFGGEQYDTYHVDADLKQLERNR